MACIQQLRNIIFQKNFRINLDGLLISKPENIYYLTGFWGTYGRLLITRKKAVLISDARYSEKAKSLINFPSAKGGLRRGFDYLELQKKEDFWSKLCKKLDIKTLGFEASVVTVSQLQKIKKAFGKGVALKKTPDVVEKVRSQKSEEEIQVLQKAAQISDKTLEAALKYLKIGVTEKEIAWILEKISREQFRGESMSFPSIVAFGKNSAIPHHETSDTKLKKNTPVLIDFGVKYQKYCSDMTRCFFFGKPTGKWLSTFELVQKAQKAGIQAIRPQQKLATPDAAVRKIFGSERKYFGHSFGHGVGLEIHESPLLSKDSKGEFAENMVVTAEPGLYFPGEFGIRLEDLLVVRAKTPEFLSRFPRKYLPSSPLASKR